MRDLSSPAHREPAPSPPFVEGTLYVNGFNFGAARQYPDGRIESGPHITRAEVSNA